MEKGICVQQKHCGVLQMQEKGHFVAVRTHVHDASKPQKCRNITHFLSLLTHIDAKSGG